MWAQSHHISGHSQAWASGAVPQATAASDCQWDREATVPVHAPLWVAGPGRFQVQRSNPRGWGREARPLGRRRPAPEVSHEEREPAHSGPRSSARLEPRAWPAALALAARLRASQRPAPLRSWPPRPASPLPGAPAPRIPGWPRAPGGVDEQRSRGPALRPKPPPPARLPGHLPLRPAREVIQGSQNVCQSHKEFS